MRSIDFEHRSCLISVRHGGDPPEPCDADVRGLTQFYPEPEESFAEQEERCLAGAGHASRPPPASGSRGASQSGHRPSTEYSPTSWSTSPSTCSSLRVGRCSRTPCRTWSGI